MNNLSAEDLALLDEASNVIKDNFDDVKFKNTVGAAVRCVNGNVYTGVNMYSLHGACAEVIAIGTAISCGEREFECVVAVGGNQSDLVYSPCGNCRQFLLDYAPNCRVIVTTKDGRKKVKITELLPYAYHIPE